jgi:AcrR family transcriptional regulator
VAVGGKISFDENEALRSAMDVFWAKGYAGSSLTDLTKSMGINKPSLYSAFGNK